MTAINFEGSTFAGVVMPFSVLTRCNFSRTIFQLTLIDKTFDEWDFSSARLFLEAGGEAAALRFMGVQLRKRGCSRLSSCAARHLPIAISSTRS